MAQHQFTGATTDQYQYLFCFGSTKLNATVTNAAIAVGFGAGGGSDAQWDPLDEVFYPSFLSLARRFDAIRFKSYVVGTPAQIVLTPVS